MLNLNSDSPGLPTSGADGIPMRIRYPSETVRNMCLIAGFASMVSSLFGVINLFNLASPIHYICNFYLLIFGAVSVILEYGAGSMDRLGVIPAVDTYWKGLTQVWGRGLFYIFQGTLTLSSLSLVNMVVGAYLSLVGLMCLAHHLGMGPRLGGVQPVNTGLLASA